MAAPLVVSFWMRAAVTFVDTIYAATIGDAAVAAVGLTLPLEFLMIAVWVGLSTGLTSRLALAMGAGNGRRVGQYVGIGWRAIAAVSPLFTIVGVGIWFTAEHLGLEADVARAFRVYGTVLIGGSAFTTFWSILPDSLVKAHQDTRSTMWAGIWTNVLNLGLNTLFVFGFGWGVFGIALSTVIGRLGGLVYALRRAAAHERARRAVEPPDRGDPDPAPWRGILSLAVPSSLTFALIATESAWVNALLARLPDSTESIAAFSIYSRIVLFAFQPIIATSVAALPYAAHRLGAGDVAGVRTGLRQALVAACVYSIAIVAPIVVVAGPWAARALAESVRTEELTRVALLAAPLACLAAAPFLLGRTVFEAMQRGKPGLAIAVLRYVVLTLPLAWVGLRIARALGVPGVWGLIAGTLVASAASSAVMQAWLGRALAERAPVAGARHVS
jgi:Na+-driven multidrug efflux pump